MQALFNILCDAPAPRRFPFIPPDTSGYVFLQWLAAINGLVFVFAFGAIVGSFLNVVVYRVPKGLNLIRPASACPSCETTLTWRENIPILGWVFLRGKCRFCRSRISPEYPLVELLTAILFTLVYALWFMDPHVPGLDPRWWAPEWARDGLLRTWPMALLVCGLLASLVAVTLIDARTFTIPLAVPWILAGTALLTHPLHAWALSMTRTPGLRSSEHPWCIPVAEGPWLAGAIAAALGLVVSNILVMTGVLKRSFADYDAWEKANHPTPATSRAESAAPSGTPEAGLTPQVNDQGTHAGPPLRLVLLRTLFLTGPAVAGMFAGFSLGLRWDQTLPGMGAGMVVGLLIGLVLRNIVKEPKAARDADPVWVQYPHARREMIRELAFLAPPALLAWGAFIFFTPDTALGGWLGTPPLWLGALGGSLLGLLVGGGTVWAIRILGSLAFGKEAMGLGDVHLMAGVGAVLGWIDPVVAFFVAPFFGLGWAVAGVLGARLFPRLGTRFGTALPYGPHLAAATVLVVFFKPLLELGLSSLSGRPVDLP